MQNSYLYPIPKQIIVIGSNKVRTVYHWSGKQGEKAQPRIFNDSETSANVISLHGTKGIQDEYKYHYIDTSDIKSLEFKY